MSLKKIFNFFSGLSLRLRLSLIFVAIFGITTILFNIFIFKVMIDNFQQDFDDALFNYTVDVSEGVEIGVKGDLKFPPLRLDDGKILPFPLGTALIQVRHSSGAVLARVGNFGQFNPPYKKDFARISAGDEATYRTIEHIGQIPYAEADSYRLISYPLENAIKPHLFLQIAVPMTLLETQVTKRLTMMEIGIPLILIIATLGGMFISSRALAPVNNIIEITQKVEGHDLSTRLPVPKTNDEIKNLALTLNEMFDRIQKAFQSQERFVADASHQLLTPLAILKQELEFFKKHPTQNSDQFIASSLQEVDNLSKVIQEMLLLARVDAGLGALNLQELSFDELLFDTLSRCEKLATSKSIKMKLDINNETTQDRKLVLGDNDLLGNLIFNIIENAIKYSPNKAVVSITLNHHSKSCELIVEDKGPGIPVDELPFIFDRFSRGTNAGAHAKGFGMGLAIAQKIARLHGAQLKAENRSECGARFSFEIKNI